MRPRIRLPIPEYNVVLDSVSIRPHIARGFLSLYSEMYAHPRKVVPKAPLHVLSDWLIQLPAWAGQDAVNAGRGRSFPICVRAGSLDLRRRTGEGRIGRFQHYVICNPIRLQFKRVAARTKHELALQPRTLARIAFT
jgi:hypothetical protein